jgi:endonuclease/exonuclease/phosphatase (EEP) superfamily protein YafD
MKLPSYFAALRTAIHWLAVILVLIGLFLKLGPRDSIAWLAPIFYGTPWLVIAGSIAVLWVLSPKLRRQLGLGFVGLLAWWLFQDFKIKQPPQSSAQVQHRVLFWNINRPEEHPKQPLLEVIASEGPDVVAILETEGVLPHERQAYVAALPGWHILWLNHDMACFAKYPLKPLETPRLPNRAKAARVEVLGPKGAWELWIADLNASPRLSRFPPLETLHNSAKVSPKTIVVGDFNTPWDSKAFDPWRAHWQHGWEVAGQGFRQTWPHGLPVLALDHAWVGRGWGIHSFGQGYRRWDGSDHAWLLLSLSLGNLMATRRVAETFESQL